MAFRRIIICVAISALTIQYASAQQKDSVTYDEQKPFLSDKGEVELFAGLDFQYRDVVLDRMYDVLLNLTPGVKWHITRHTLLSAQAWIPLVNTYGEYYSRPKLNILTISHEWKFGKMAFKPTAGLFSMERYGIDLKAMLPVNSWLAFEGQAGWTGYLSMVGGWHMSGLSRFLAVGGADFYIRGWDTEFRLVGGHFLKDDNGVYAEGMRHFSHTTVGLYLQYSDSEANRFGLNGGFKVVIAIPPYNRARHRVQFRPANNFRLTYNMKADARSCKVYDTDPEQNERHGWFSPDILPWGKNINYDFREK